MNNVVKIEGKKFKVVESAPANRHSPRPVKVFYEGGGIGHCKSVKSALACATKHMLEDGFTRANVTYEDVPVADIVRHKQQVHLTWKRYALKIGV
tara:strand:- start:24960 stop:25244 length:285 start_codon:yes stop_codon:yes gene_type:complete